MTDDIILAGQVAGAVLAVITLITTVVKFGVVKPIKAYIDKATYQIQPHANGGKSLADVAELVRKIDTRVEDISKRVKLLEKLNKSK